ncbi:50S ribosomal protein L25 [Candidatus Azambacteria bacterium]|nr:50S ribosomal protein L25 [Candidatus Azambacteria bacterium]
MKLNAKNRELTGSKVKSLRQNGDVPAVLYGKDFKNVNLALNAKEFFSIYQEAGESTVLDVHIEGDKKDHNVLIHHVDFDPITEGIIHVDFYKVDMNKEVTAKVPLVFSGESEAVKTGNGVLVKSMHDVEVSALPKNLPHEITIDLSILKTFEDVITVSDISVSEGVKIKAHADDVIASVKPPRTQAEIDSLSTEVSAANLEEIKSESEEKKAKKEEEVEE